MTWRRFQVLVRCLSPNSATVTKLQGTRYFGQKRDDAVTVTSPKAAEAAFQAAFKK